MPSKIKPPTSPGKNRDSQRRSRARRKELIESLSREVAQFKSQGVAASMAMQNAARAVSAENKQLRELLALYGVSEVDISTYLASSQQSPYTASALFQASSSAQTATATAESLNAQSRPDASEIPTRKAVELESLNGPNYRKSRTSIPLSNAARSELTNTDKLERPAETLESIALTHTKTLSSQATWRSHDETGSHYQSDDELCAHSWQGDHENGSQPISSGYGVADHGMLPSVSDYSRVQKPLALEKPNMLETSCDSAAEILIQLHRKADPVETRAALGCVGATSCSVKNTTIFKLMDEFS